MSTTSFRLDEDLEIKLDSIAQSMRRSKSWIINDALRCYIEREEKKQQMLRQTEEALADLEAGNIVSGEAVMKWLESWGTQTEQDAPKL